jgi:peptidoglycan/xylan/chitin deacetylase (PgdA/CDA1 family)
VFGPSVWRGPRDRRAIALTFDDGPSESTPWLLDVLGRYRVPATFFQIGSNVERLPSIARAVVEVGSEVGNHGHGHRMYCTLTPEGIWRDLSRAQNAIAGATGVTPVLMRAPFGVRWFGLRAAQERLGVLGVMWSAIGYDWNSTAERVRETIATRVSNGAIICLHDGRELRRDPDISVTLDAVSTLVPMLQDQGYEFRTVSQLLCPKT